MNRVVHFEIQADDPDRAMKFYKDVFGWNFERWNSQEYWMIMTAEKNSKEPGINGGLLPRPAKMPPNKCGTNAFTCTVQVLNFDKTAKKIKAAGGIVAMPKFPILGMAWQGYFKIPKVIPLAFTNPTRMQSKTYKKTCVTRLLKQVGSFD